MQKKIQQLTELLPGVTVIGTTDKTVTDITADSRVVQQGSLFIALKGAHVDGHTFLGKRQKPERQQPWWKIFPPWFRKD